MANELERSLGQTGEMVEKSSQDWVANRLYLSEGACLSICAKFMTGIFRLELPTKDDYAETAQWIQESPGFLGKVDLLATSVGLRKIGTESGRLMYDEIYLGNFIREGYYKPCFVIFGFFNTMRNAGHALLFYNWGGDDWLLLDPNFGLAKWPHLGGLLVGLKKLLSNAYPDFGPYYRFDAYKYSG